VAKFWLCLRYEDMEPGLCTIGDIRFQLTTYSTYPDAVTCWILGMDFRLYRLTFDSMYRHILTPFKVPWERMTDVCQLPRYLSVSSPSDLQGTIIVPQVTRLATYLLEHYGTLDITPS
jgi:hypothetical protein